MKSSYDKDFSRSCFARWLNIFLNSWSLSDTRLIPDRQMLDTAAVIAEIKRMSGATHLRILPNTVSDPKKIEGWYRIEGYTIGTDSDGKPCEFLKAGGNGWSKDKALLVTLWNLLGHPIPDTKWDKKYLINLE